MHKRLDLLVDMEYVEKPGSGYEFCAKELDPDLVDMKRIHNL